MKTTKKNKRFIQLQAIDPTGISFDKTRKMDYYFIGYRNNHKSRPPEEYPSKKIMVDGIELELQEEPMKKVRYLLTIGDYEYIVNRDGKIVDVIVGPDKNNMF